jgi:putative restriction endonuclease
LWSKLWAALPNGSKALTPAHDVRPLLAEVPSTGTFRIYLWTLTEDRSKGGARPPGEFKIQLIVPGQSPGEYGSLDLAGQPTALLGYSADFGVFVGWEARLYTDFAYSTNVQVREDLLTQARDEGWAVAPPRQSQGSEEVRVAFSPTHLSLFLAASVEADEGELDGERREAFFLSKAPRVETGDVPADPAQLPAFIRDTRSRITATRLIRDPRFSADVKREYDFACAVCTAQLGIIEAAHIIPASEEAGADEVWNGIALCPNHHRLFDSRLFVIDPELVMRVDRQRIEFLVECDRASGLDQITNYADRPVLPPAFWSEAPASKAQMQAALRWVVEKAGMIP